MIVRIQPWNTFERLVLIYHLADITGPNNKSLGVCLQNDVASWWATLPLKKKIKMKVSSSGLSSNQLFSSFGKIKSPRKEF